MDLFEYMSMQQDMKEESPLAVTNASEDILMRLQGSSILSGKDKLLYRAIKADKISSLIFYGPPGTGKTTLAKVIANTTSARFRADECDFALERKIWNRRLSQAKDAFRACMERKPSLFIDEIHRFQ